MLFFCCWVNVLLRGGRRAELAVVTLEVEGEGVEFVGEDEAAVCAPVKSGVSVKEDIFNVAIRR